MRKRLFLYTTALLLAGLLGLFCISIYVTGANNLNLAKDMVMETAMSYAGLYAFTTDLAAFVKTSGDTRITVISKDGKVMADSRPLDIASLENHLSRPEILSAADGAPAAFARHSDSLGVDMIYYAVKAPLAEDFVYIRAAIPVAKIDAYLYRSLPPLIIMLLVIIVVCFITSRGMINRITKPFYSIEQNLRLLSAGGYAPQPIAGSYEEIDQIAQSIDEIALLLQKGMNGLREEKAKLDYILGNIGDGLIVLDPDKNITLINPSALSIFSAKPDVVGKNLSYLSFDKELTEAVNICADDAGAALFELSQNGRIYLAAVKRLPDTGLTMAAFSDVTENRENAKRREEFFANASHELKTPLAAIKGFNELTEINNKDEKIGKFVDGISRETDRMLTLIGDMLKLSELENTPGIDPAPVSLAQAVADVREALAPAISEKAIMFGFSGDAVVNAESGHVYELIKNLAENAVRYSERGGRVTVTAVGGKNGASLTVADDGIGISPEEQSRIFERFYRVEKSRSVRGGGTGLGLSIVKHICALYDWKLSLKSKPGVGTEVTVAFSGKFA